MPNITRPTMEKLAEAGWGEAFRREFELVAAANVFREMQTNEILYDTVLEARLAYHCAPLDGGLKEEYLGVIAVPDAEAADWKRAEEAISVLKGKPRGTWAVFEMGGAYDAYMSDGLGGVATQSGYKFKKTRPDAPDLSFENLYGAVLSYPAYECRNRIKNEILAESFKSHGLQPGHTVKDGYVGGKRWNKVEFVRVLKGYYVGNSDAVQVRCTRRGVKPKDFAIEPTTFIGLFEVPVVLPERYANPGNEARLTSLPEQRQIAAQEAWMDVVEHNPPANLSRWGSAATFHTKGDTYTRNLYSRDGDDISKIGEFAVTFEPGSLVIADRAMTLEDESAPRMA